MIEKLRRIVESLGYPFFFGSRDEVYAYLNSVPTVVACYRQGGGGSQQFFVFKFKGDKPQRMYEEVMREIKRQFTVGVQRIFFYEDVLEARFPLMAKTYTEGGVRPTPPPPPPVVNEYMYFEAKEANSTVSMISTLATAPNLEYSTDGETWQEWHHTTADYMHTFDTLTLTYIGDRVYLKGVNPNGFSDIANNTMSIFSMTGKLAAGGNAQSIVDGDTPTLVAKSMPLFSDYLITEQTSDVLVSAPDLPATTLVEFCYIGMFGGCTGLTAAPSLPATTLAANCYNYMFQGCTGLTAAPSLPATTLAANCYIGMFQGCTGLTAAPSLPATTLAEYCYNYMFQGCTGLTAAPSLPATTLAEYCYNYMFQDCTGLTAIEVHATEWNTSWAGYWVESVSVTGTFRKPSGTTIPTGTNGIPSGWTVENF